MLRLVCSATAVQNKRAVTEIGGVLPDLHCFKGATPVAGPCKDLEKASNEE